MVMDDVEILSRFFDPQIAFEFGIAKSALSPENTSNRRDSVPSCTEFTSGDEASILLDYFGDPNIDSKSGR